MKCDRCQAERPDSQMNYEIKGYEHPRMVGGVNHVQARRRTGRVICNGCLTEVKLKVHKNQMKLSA